ncbi:hypothetical protein GALMADRAFT_245117 [Galerina marginata CBS 339.88]|uniref:MYND-type domain-containing protein n=1 Tax=Galerina marginata (strain CBS 339.88) TaxID=685588 RepID=A0A067T4Q0_GALM3|nr:hypothetical protein GALMADRAFT_245117 [Galerina marginata CBS 339.88]
MNRNLGMEAMMGLGGGIVSEESRKNLEIAEGLCRRRKPNLAAPYLLKALKQDPNNLDAIIQMAFLLGIEGALETLQMAELQGRAMLKEKLGDDCFDDDGDAVGKFWLILPTRPYMRVLQALVKVYFDAGKYDDSAKTMIEMMRLCPGDNMGQRFWVGSVLIRCGRYADALHFCQEWMTDDANGKGIPPPRGGTAFKAPHKNTMAVKKEKNYEYTAGAILYSAALASFRHFGDCEQSRQYLKLGAKLNPNVLLKILANVKRPTNLNNEPRGINGPEDAQDYLWLTQDLWMATDVWNWANDNPDVKSAVLKVCSRSTCGVREVRVGEYKRCSACHLVSYCSGACQKDDWVRHKPECLDHKKQKAAIRAFSMGKAPPRDGPIPMFASDMMGAMPL